MKLGDRLKSNVMGLLKITSAKPTNIAIELTNRCNLNCPFCLVGMQNELDSVAHDNLGRPWGKMTLDLGEKIIRDARDFGISSALLTFQGEPLLHEDYLGFIYLTKKYGLRSITFTNGMLLTPELSRKIIRAGLDSIRFSVDGASQEVYKKNRVGGDFDKVYGKMADFAKIAREEKSDIEMLWQFIALKNNEHEIETARNLAEKIQVPFFVKTFAESVPELAPRDPQYKRKLYVKPCADIYRSIFVYWNGDVVPCCYDLVGKEVMGNAQKYTIREIWEGDRYVSFRKRLKEIGMVPANEPELCRSCLKWQRSVKSA